MPATPLVKFMGRSHGNGRGQLQWGRADVDGAPYRGNSPMMLTEDEAEERLVRVSDPHNALFDLSDPEHNALYLQVLDEITNGLSHLLKREHILVRFRRRYRDDQGATVIERDVKIKVYMEWTTCYMEDGKPMHSQRPLLGRPNEE